MAAAGKLRVHIKNNRAGEEVFRITPARWRAACRRHPETAQRITACIDWDLDRFDVSMRRAGALLTWDLPTDDLAVRAPALRLIHVIGAGVEHLAPFDWLPPGVRLTNNRGVHADKAADYLTMALLMLNAGLPKLAGDQRARRWDPVFTGTIAGKTVAVVGTGHMGAVAARCGRRLKLKVLGVRRRPRPTAHFDEVAGVAALPRVLARADFVVAALPETPATRGLLDARAIAAMKPGAGLINIGRAATLDHAALAAALGSGRLSGAILDVFAREPLPRNDPLWRVANLLITPHVSSDNLDGYVPKTLDLFFANLARLLAGRRLLNRVDPSQGY